MEQFFTIFIIATAILSLPLMILLLRNGGFYEHFIAIIALSTFVSIMLIVVGFIDGRRDMYVDIALSFSILNFISSVIVAKFMSGRGGKTHD
ncbi:MAG: pH regulation protein F [Firmicutes bacterium]|nr:pH regulation protein F [Bacillota bacterium]